MHQAASDFIREQLLRLQTDKPFDAVLEIGSRNVNGTIRDLFPLPPLKYWGIDLHPGPCVDEVIDFLDFPSLTSTPAGAPVCDFDMICCCEVLEHTPHWDSILRRTRDLLNPYGTLLVTCAGPGRSPHSIDGHPLPPNEYYSNPHPLAIYSILQPLYSHIEIRTPNQDIQIVARC